MNRFRTMLLLCPVLVLSCGKDPVRPSAGSPDLDRVKGDIEGDEVLACTATTLATANSIHVGTSPFSASMARTYAALLDTAGTTTSLSFVFDSGGISATVICDGAGGSDDLERDMIRANGPVLIRPWHIEGLSPFGLYQMSFIGGGASAPRRSMRVFVDADASGTLEPSEVEDLIGLDGVVETRVFGQPIKANAYGVILGEYWGGSTNAAGENGAWRGFTIQSAPK